MIDNLITMSIKETAFTIMMMVMVDARGNAWTAPPPPPLLKAMTVAGAGAPVPLSPTHAPAPWPPRPAPRPPHPAPKPPRPAPPQNHINVSMLIPTAGKKGTEGAWGRSVKEQRHCLRDEEREGKCMF